MFKSVDYVQATYSVTVYTQEGFIFRNESVNLNLFGTNRNKFWVDDDAENSINIAFYGKDAILVYESFEKIIESVLQKTRAVMVLLDMKDVLSIKIELDRVKSTQNLLEIQKKFEKCNGTFETFSEEDTLYIRGTLPLLGGGVS